MSEFNLENLKRAAGDDIATTSEQTATYEYEQALAELTRAKKNGSPPELLNSLAQRLRALKRLFYEAKRLGKRRKGLPDEKLRRAQATYPEPSTIPLGPDGFTTSFQCPVFGDIRSPSDEEALQYFQVSNERYERTHQADRTKR